MTPLRIGTRGSRLALWQANFVAEKLRPLAGARAIELVEIQTAGDRLHDAPLPALGGQGIFTKEIQHALLAGTIDVAVHSLKDLPTTLVEGLVLAAVPSRGPAGDALVSKKHRTFDELPLKATLATSSLRRQAQVLYRRPDLSLVHIRGNVETRLRKLEERNLDGLILAQAGLERLGLREAMTELLDPSWMLPAVGQGALGLECRADDRATLDLVVAVDDFPTRQAVCAERSLLRSLGGGCQMPIGAATSLNGLTLTLRGVVLDAHGQRRIESRVQGPLAAGDALGQRLAADLLARGASELLGGT